MGVTFYRLLFDKAPELYNIFNQTNQKRDLQQEALGYAVCILQILVNLIQ
nr:hypothetical protein [Terribacillus sp. DMT04]